MRADFASWRPPATRCALVRVHRRPRRHGVECERRARRSRRQILRRHGRGGRESQVPQVCGLCLVLIDFAWLDDPLRRARARIDGLHRSRARSFSRSLRQPRRDSFLRRDQRTRLAAGMADRQPARVRRSRSGSHPSEIARARHARQAAACGAQRSGTIPRMGSTSCRCIRIPTFAIPIATRRVFGRTAADLRSVEAAADRRVPIGSAPASRGTPVARIHARRLPRARARRRISRRVALEFQGCRCVWFYVRKSVGLTAISP